MLAVKNLSVVAETKEILKDVQFILEPGTKVLLTGPSGSGKSTFLQALLFFKPGFSGDIYFKEKLITPSNINWYRSHFSYIGQKPPFFEGSVLQFLRYPFHFKANKHYTFKKENVIRIFDQLSISHSLLHQDYPSLSGGEQQRVTIVQSLLLDKKYLFLDEVTSALDETNIRNVIEAVCNDPELTVLTVSHNHQWRQKSDLIYVVDDKKVVLEKYEESGIE